MPFHEDHLGAAAHHGRARQRRRDVARLVPRRHDHADARAPRRRRRPAVSTIAQHVDPVERHVLHPRRAHQVAVERGPHARHVHRHQQAVLVTHHLEADDVEQVAVVGVGEPVRRGRRPLPAGHLRHPHGQLPHVIEGRHVDAAPRRQLALEADEQRLHVDDAVGQPIADDGVPRPGRGGLQPRPGGRDVADLEPDVRVARACPFDRVGQVVDAHAPRVGQRRQQITLTASRLEHRCVGRDDARERLLQIVMKEVARVRVRGHLARPRVVIAPSGVQRVRQLRRRRVGLSAR